MVKRLYGKCNGADIVFSQDEQGRWSIPVPASDDKTYIIEVWAEDEAGNVGYFATVEVTYDSDTLRMQFRVIEFGAMGFHWRA